MNKEPSIKSSLSSLLDAFNIVDSDSQIYHAVPSAQLTNGNFQSIAAHFAGDVTVKIVDFSFGWTGSMHAGVDALTARLDEKLVEQGSLDMDLFKKILFRMSKGEDGLRTLKRTRYHASDFLSKCIQSRLN